MIFSKIYSRNNNFKEYSHQVFVLRVVKTSKIMSRIFLVEHDEKLQPNFKK